MQITTMQTNIQRLCRAGLLCAALCVLAVITIPTGGVSFTLGLLGIFLCGMLLPPLYALGAVCAYLVLGIIGLPVFSGMQSGAGVLFGITGGFLWAYPLMALCISAACKYLPAGTRRMRFVIACAAAVLSLVICYALGAAWFAVYAQCSVAHALEAAVLPFIGFDICKAVAAALLSCRLPRP